MTRSLEDVWVGQEIGPLAKGPLTTMHLMRWSAAIENWHRIHYDQGFAVGHDGLPDVVVAGSWKQHVLAQLLKDWAGPNAWLLRLRLQNRGTDCAGVTLRARGRVTAVEQCEGHALATCAIELLGALDAPSTIGEAVVLLPLQRGGAAPTLAAELLDHQYSPSARGAESAAAARLITGRHRELVGASSERQFAPEPVERGAIRRFAQAVMDADPIYRDGAATAPPLFPLHALRCAPGAPDPLDAAWSDPEFDGFGQLSAILGLQPLALPLKRFMNGGSDHLIASIACVGEQISAVSRYEDLFVKDGKEGPLVFGVIHSRFEAGQPGSPDRRLLVSTRQNYLWR